MAAARSRCHWTPLTSSPVQSVPDVCAGPGPGQRLRTSRSACACRQSRGSGRATSGAALGCDMLPSPISHASVQHGPRDPLMLGAGQEGKLRPMVGAAPEVRLAKLFQSSERVGNKGLPTTDVIWVLCLHCLQLLRQPCQRPVHLRCMHRASRRDTLGTNAGEPPRVHAAGNMAKPMSGIFFN